MVGQPDEIKGEGVCCFVTLKQGLAPTEQLKKELREHVAREIGALARPDAVRFTETLPKTRSGKQTTGDTTTLEDYSVLAKLREAEEG